MSKAQYAVLATLVLALTAGNRAGRWEEIKRVPSHQHSWGHDVG
jgi:hypothetical protein